MIALIENISGLDGILPMLIIDKNRKCLSRMAPGIGALPQTQLEFSHIQERACTIDGMAIIGD